MKFTQQLGFFIRSFFLQTGWNFQKYQNLGMFFIMWPFVKKLYRDKQEEIPSVVIRYLSTFNTQPVIASFCFGALARQEKFIANAKDLNEINEETLEWNSIKQGLSITTASIGDRLFWGTLKPLTLLLGLFIWLLLGVHVFELQHEEVVPLIYAFAGGGAAFLAFNTIAFFVKWEGIKISYETPASACFGLTKFDWNRTIYNAKKIGLTLTIGLILMGIYYYLRDFQQVLDVHFVTRAIIVLFFVCISFLTHRLRIPNIYLYLVSVILFNIFCYL